MEIVFLSRFQGEVSRGAETYVENLSSQLMQLGNTVLIRKNIFDSVPADAQILVGVNGRLDNIFARKLSFLSGTKFVISGHSGPGLDDRINLYTFPSVFIALSEYQRKWAKKINPFVRVEKIPNGVDLEKFNSSVKKINPDLPGPVILCVSAFTTQKRLDLAIKAVSRLKTASLWLVGRGEEEKHLVELGNRLLPGRFKTSAYPHTQMPGVYLGADIFTFPTVPWESFGIVLLEAMASGLPVVSTDDPIRREIVGEAGLYTDPSDSAAYASALNVALKTDWENKPRIQAEKYPWSKIALEYHQLFEKLCSP